jgi:hypothetical protein
MKLIDAWRKDTGEKLPDQVPESWIRDDVNPNLSATPPQVPAAVTPPETEPGSPSAPAPTPEPNTQEA